MHLADKNLLQRDRWLQLVKNSSVLGSKIFLAPLEKNATEHQQLYSLCFVGNRFENGIERAPGSANLMGAQALRISLTEDWCFDKHEHFRFFQWWSVVFHHEIHAIFIRASLVSEVRKLGSSKPMTFADFLGLWGFLTFDDFLTFWLFDDLDESTTVSSALSPPPTTSSFSALNAFGADNLDDPVVFNILSKWCNYPAEALDETSIDIGWTPKCQHNMAGYNLP